MGFLNILLGAMFATFVIAMFLLPVEEANREYDANIDTSGLASFDLISNVTSSTTNIRTQVLNTSEVTTAESESDFATNAFSLTKFIFTGGPLFLIDGMLRDFIKVTHLPSQVYLLIYGVVILILSFAVVRGIFGR